jgi:hypothetical protein
LHLDSSVFNIKRSTLQLSVLCQSIQRKVNFSLVANPAKIDLLAALFVFVSDLVGPKLKLALRDTVSLHTLSSLLFERGVELLLLHLKAVALKLKLANAKGLLKLLRDVKLPALFCEALTIKLLPAASQCASSVNLTRKLSKAEHPLQLIPDIELSGLLANLVRPEGLLELLGLAHPVGLKLSEVLAAGKISELASSLHGGKAILSLRLSSLHQKLGVKVGKGASLLAC